MSGPSALNAELAAATQTAAPLARQRHRHRSYGPARRWLALRFEYLCLRLATAAMSCVPRRTALWLGEQLGALARCLRIRRRIVRRNLEFVGYSPDEQRRIERQLYRLTGRYAVDMARGGNHPFVLAEGSGDALDEALRSSHGVLVLFSHLGNWEMLVPSFLVRFAAGVIVAKPMRNPLVNHWLEAERRRNAPGIGFVPPANAPRHCLRCLREGGAAAFAIDQYGGSTGLPTPFLGKETSTVRSTAGIAARTQCIVVGAYALLDNDNTYRLEIEPVPPTAPGTPVPSVLASHNDRISGWVRRYPEHWFGWFHRRFKDVVQYD